MCHRFIPLSLEEVQEALASLRQYRRALFAARTSDDADGAAQDAYPGSQVPVIVPDRDAGLQALVLSWGFRDPRTVCAPAAPPTAPAPKTAGKVIFNTRLDTAVRQLNTGRGMWAQAIDRGRCLVPARAFYERDSSRRAVRFAPTGSGAFLMAGVAQDGRFSIVTTEPNAQVAPIHSRMPLVLGPGESSAWLAGDFDRLADRSAIALEASPEP